MKEFVRLLVGGNRRSGAVIEGDDVSVLLLERAVLQIKYGVPGIRELTELSV